MNLPTRASRAPSPYSLWLSTTQTPEKPEEWVVIKDLESAKNYVLANGAPYFLNLEASQISLDFLRWLDTVYDPMVIPFYTLHTENKEVASAIIIYLQKWYESRETELTDVSIQEDDD